MSPDARKAQGLALTPAEEKLVARQVNGLCVYTYVMTVVCARVTVLIGDCAHGRMVCHSRTYNGLRQVGCTQPSTQSATQVGQHSNQPSVNCEQP